MTNPTQPIIDGRFKKNQIVDDLLEFSQTRGFGLNEIAQRDYSADDRRQLAQLIGYSVSGYGTLSYVDDLSYNVAEGLRLDKDADEKQVRINLLELQISRLKEALRNPIAELFEIHPDDLG